MCGIFGSYNLIEFKELMKLNLERGSTSIGIMRMTKKPYLQYFIERFKLESFDIDKWCDNAGKLERSLKMERVYHLGHVQAPTEGQEFSTNKESHPFETNNLAWAHNGIIQNQFYIRQTFLIPDKPVTDSFVIGCLVDNLAMDFTVLQELDGTFTCWLFDKRNGDIYLFRATNSLYFTDKTNGAFSSIHPQVEDAYAVPQGWVMKLTNNGFVNHTKFNIKSQPFHIPEN